MATINIQSLQTVQKLKLGCVHQSMYNSHYVIQYIKVEIIWKVSQSHTVKVLTAALVEF